jgi:hypothetical protein
MLLPIRDNVSVDRKVAMAIKTPTWLRIVAAIALLWNAIGVFFYLVQVGLIASPPDMPRTELPAAITAAYAIGVFGAVAGCLGLLLGRRWAYPVLLVSLIALIIDWGWQLTNTAEASLPLGITVLAIAVILPLLARRAIKAGWLR